MTRSPQLLRRQLRLCKHSPSVCVFFFFFNDTATTEIYTLSLHDALPICRPLPPPHGGDPALGRSRERGPAHVGGADRKSTRLNSSHLVISYAVFCLKKKKNNNKPNDK